MGGLGGDNMTLIIVCCLHGKPWESLVEKCKKYHTDKKALSKLHEPAFNTFDRFAADGPFSEVIKGADDPQNTNETSSSSHTSSPSSSPISAEEKFDGLTTESIAVEDDNARNEIQANEDISKHSTPVQIVDISVNPPNNNKEESVDTTMDSSAPSEAAPATDSADSNVATETAVSSTD